LNKTEKNTQETSSKIAHKTKEIEEILLKTKCTIQCENCGYRYPSQIHLGDEKTYNGTVTEGNLANCPNCGKFVGNNKTNMIFEHRDYRNEEGIVTYIEGEKTIKVKSTK